MNLKVAPTLAIEHPYPHCLPLLIPLRRHRGLPGPTTQLTGCLPLWTLHPLAMYLDLVFIYVRDLALAHARPDPNFCVSPCLVLYQTLEKEQLLLGTC